MKTSSKVLLALGCGAAAGAILGILFAPDKGSETRKKIAKKTTDLTDKVKEMKSTFATKKDTTRSTSRSGRPLVDNEINDLVS